MAAESELITKRFSDKTYILRQIFKPAEGKAKQQYRYFHVCETCGMKKRLVGQIDHSAHACSADKQRSITDFTTSIDTTTFSHAKLVCSTNISVSAATSKEFYMLFDTVYKLGQKSIINQIPENIREKIRKPSPEEMYKHLSRTQFAKELVSLGGTIKMIHFSYYRYLKYASLTIDAGRINTVSIIDLILQNPFSKQKPLLIIAKIHFGGEIKDYLEVAKEAIAQAKDNGVVISCFVGDNLCAQKNALSPSSERSLQKSDKKYAGFFWFSCACHTSALGFSDTVASEDDLEAFSAQIKTAAKIFRSKPMVSILQTICPSYCPTRWTNLYDIVHWVIKKDQQIIELFKNPEKKIVKLLLKMDFEPIYTIQVPIIFMLLSAYKAFVTQLESSTTPAAYVLPLLNDFEQKTTELVSYADDIGIKDCLRIGQKLIHFIIERFASIYGGPCLTFLFYLTPRGRIEARKRYTPNFEHGQDIKDFSFSEKIEIKLRNEEVYDTIKDFLLNRESKQKIIQDFYEKYSKKDNDESDAYSEVSDVVEEFNDDLENGMFSNEISCELHEIDDFIKERAINIAIQKGLNDEQQIEYSQRMIKQFDDWIRAGIEHDSLVLTYTDSPYRFWLDYGEKFSRVREFSEFALLHLSIPANSADCERMLWRQNRQVPPDRFKTGQDLMMARLIISQYDK